MLVCSFAGHPFDTIKTKMQSQASAESTSATIMKTMEAEGFKGLYRGMTPPLLSVGVITMLVFSS